MRASHGLLLAAALFPSLAVAEHETVVDTTIQALFAGRPDARDGEIKTVVPLLGMVSMRATGISAPGFDDVRIVLSAWGQVDPAEPRDDDHVEGDVLVGHVEGEALDRRLRLRLGRQLLLGGAGRATPFDGLLVDGRLFAGLGLSAEVGVPVTPRFAIDRGDVLWGGRLYYRQSVDAEVGLSYLHVLDDGRLARFDLGADARWQPGKWLFGGAAVLAAEEQRLAEALLYAGRDFSRQLRIEIEGSRTAPDLFLPRSSILSVFSEETRDEVGGTVTYRPLVAWRLECDGRALHIEDGWGARASLRADYRRPAYTLGAEARGLKLPDDGYLNFRLFGRAATTQSSAATLDLSLYALDEPFNGEHLSVSATATWGLDIAPGWHLVASGVAASDPLYQRRFEGMVRVAKDFVWRQRSAQ